MFFVKLMLENVLCFRLIWHLLQIYFNQQGNGISYKLMHYAEFPLKNHSPNLLKLLLSYETNLTTAARYKKNGTSVIKR